jgi:PEGA domain-containing protein
MKLSLGARSDVDAPERPQVRSAVVRCARLALLLFALPQLGCAAMFRERNARVRIESDPAGADAREGERWIGATPTEAVVKRRGSTTVTVTKAGFVQQSGRVRKRVNREWLILDIATCIPALCIPLVVDAVTGAWLNVDATYTATLEPEVAGATSSTTASTTPSASGAPTTPAPTPSNVPRGPEMSESERKATARAAYVEGVQLQDKRDHAGALARFETAQRLFTAPTHLQHIAQCQLALGKLVEAQETYESLARTKLGPTPSEAFREAQEEARKELPRLRSRIPTLRIDLAPPAGSLPDLVVKVNGGALPNEVLGLARPVNPGPYKISASAPGYASATAEVDVKEGASRTVDMKLSR